MFDESAAVPAADEDAAFPDESQPLGPYTCTMDEAGGCHSATLCLGLVRTQVHVLVRPVPQLPCLFGSHALPSMALRHCTLLNLHPNM